MGTWEWPLILFTVLGQVAVGMILVLWWLDRYSIDHTFFKQSVLVSGILLCFALVASLFHLGHPEAAYRALAHLGSSWLSREILFFILTFAAWVYLFWQTTRPSGNHRTPLILTSVLGILGIISSAMIYVLPRVPAWNNAAPIFFFLLTTGLLGALVILVLGAKKLQPSQKNRLLQWSLYCIVASILLFIFYGSLLNVNAQGAVTVNLLMTSPLFWIRAVLGWIVPFILLINLLKNKTSLNQNLVLSIVLFAGIGEILGRALFYLSAVGIHITALF